MAEDRIGMVTLRNVRLSYPHLFRPAKGQPDDNGNMKPGKFGAQLLIDPETDIGKKNLAALKAAKAEVMAEKWGSKPPKLTPDRIATRKYSIPVDEDGDPDEDAADPAYIGMYYVSARNPERPQIIDNVKQGGKWRRLQVADGKPYGGCYVNAIIRLWAQDNEYGKRVNAALELVQFYKHGDSFGAGPIDPESILDDDVVDGADVEDGSDGPGDYDFDEDGGDDLV